MPSKENYLRLAKKLKNKKSGMISLKFAKARKKLPSLTDLDIRQLDDFEEPVKTEVEQSTEGNPYIDDVLDEYDLGDLVQEAKEMPGTIDSKSEAFGDISYKPRGDYDIEKMKDLLTRIGQSKQGNTYEISDKDRKVKEQLDKAKKANKKAEATHKKAKEELEKVRVILEKARAVLEVLNGRLAAKEAEELDAQIEEINDSINDIPWG